MQHIAIDLGGRESQVCIRAPDGKILSERRVRTRKLGSVLKGQPGSRVILETCSEAFHVADQALGLGLEVRVVPATLVRSLGVGSRGVKTDQRDARILSEVSCRIDLPSVHIPSETARRIKTLCGMRDGLVESRTKLINSVRGWLRSFALRPRTGTTRCFVVRIRALVEQQAIEVPRYVERQLRSIEFLTEQIDEANEDVKHMANEMELCQRLMTVPGVGPVTALRFVSAIDQVGRFKSAAAVESYLGLTPGERSSGDKRRRTSITKAGSAHARWALVQAAWAARRYRGGLDPMAFWSNKVQERRGKRIAIVALARKIAGVLYALWRDGSTYDATCMLRKQTT